MSSTAYLIAQHLIAESICVAASSTADWSAHVASEPRLTRATVTVYDSGGGEPDTDELDLRQSIQVRTRSKSYTESYEKQEEIRDALIEEPIEAGGLTLQIFMTSDIISLGLDEENKMYVHTTNYRVMKERS